MSDFIPCPRPSIYFKLFELLPDVKLYGWNVLDQRLVDSLDMIRKAWGKPIYVNYGDKHLRGFRPASCPIGAPKSQHKEGKAADCDFHEASAEEARKFIIDNQSMWPHVGRLEADVNWVHIGIGGRVDGKIHLFHP